MLHVVDILSLPLPPRLLEESNGASPVRTSPHSATAAAAAAAAGGSGGSHGNKITTIAAKPSSSSPSKKQRRSVAQAAQVAQVKKKVAMYESFKTMNPCSPPSKGISPPPPAAAGVANKMIGVKSPLCTSSVPSTIIPVGGVASPILRAKSPPGGSANKYDSVFPGLDLGSTLLGTRISEEEGTGGGAAAAGGGEEESPVANAKTADKGQHHQNNVWYQHEMIIPSLLRSVKDPPQQLPIVPCTDKMGFERSASLSIVAAPADQGTTDIIKGIQQLHLVDDQKATESKISPSSMVVEQEKMKDEPSQERESVEVLCDFRAIKQMPPDSQGEVSLGAIAQALTDVYLCLTLYVIVLPCDFR